MVRDEDVNTIGAFLAEFSRQELYGLLVVQAAMTDIDQPVRDLLAWAGWEDPQPAVRLVVSATGRRVQPCGTSAAYQRHRAVPEEPCEACSEARRAENAKASERRKKRRHAARATTGVAA